MGWHKDRSVFGDVVGISLLSPCTFRLCVKTGQRWERRNLIAEPGSVYLLRGAAHTEFPALKAFAIRSPSGTHLKGMHKHGPDVHLAETAPADARHADR
jgi:alkylated DNA repair dioxygenase AlkB